MTSLQHRRLAGRYELQHVLGTGGMAEVWAARDLVLRRDVAVKVLRPAADAPSARERFAREGRAAARLNHPTIVQVLDAGEDEGIAFLVMERLPGPTLADEIARGPMTVGRVRAVAADVLAALAAAHGAGIVHRDVKPQNVLIDEAGRAKVTDFGIAKVLDAGDATTGLVYGTAAYLAPERAAGLQATTRSDLFSLGVVLYEALAGRHPFQAESTLALMRAVAQDEPPPIEAVRPDVDATLASGVRRAMAKIPADRFASAQDMAAAMSGASPAADTAPLAAAATVPLQPRTPTEALPQDERPRRPRLRKVWVGAVAVVVAVGVAALLQLAAGDAPAPSPSPTLAATPLPTPTTEPTPVPATPRPAPTTVVGVVRCAVVESMLDNLKDREEEINKLDRNVREISQRTIEAQRKMLERQARDCEDDEDDDDD